MAPSPQPPAYPSTNSMPHDFIPPSVPRQRSSISRLQLSTQDNLSFNGSFVSSDIPSQTSIEFKRSQASAQLSLDPALSFFDNNYIDLQNSSELLQDLSQDLIPYTGIRHEPRVSPHEPWTSFDVVTSSARSEPGHTLQTIQQNNKKLPTDSGYASSRLSRPFIHINTRQSISLDAPLAFTYDEPLGSAEQQNLILPDQQRQVASSQASVERSQTSGKATTDPVTGSGTQSGTQAFRCDQCDSEVFHTKSELSKHMARHSKKHTCDISTCARATEGFATKNDLDRHKSSVHHDHSVARKEYRCSVQDCKDPGKVWDRKDNFKAHVKRMHPDADADLVVEQSFQRPSHPSTDQASSQAGSHVHEYPPPSYMQPLSGLQPQTPMTNNLHDGYGYSEAPDLWQEGDLYDAPTPLTRAPVQSPLAASPFGNPAYIQNASFAPATTIGPSLHPSSHTLYAPSGAQGPIMSHRQEMSPFIYQNLLRPVGPNTAPNPGQVTDDFGSQTYHWTHNSSASPTIDNNMSTMDQIGAWLPTTSPVCTPHVDIIESHQSSAQPVNEEQVSSVADEGHRRHERLRAIMDQMEQMSREERLPMQDIKNMVQNYEKSLSAPYENDHVVKPVLDAPKPNYSPEDNKYPYRCSREGCSKAFTQNNIRKKHEKRHDRLFFCTFDGCYSTFGSKDDLRRHESRKHAPNESGGWRCFTDDVPTSQHKPECFKFFEDSEKFRQHRREEHKERAAANNGGLKAMKQCHVLLGEPGHFWCGFCNKVIQNEPNGTDGTKLEKFRYDHIDQHVTKEKLAMKHWVDLRSEGLRKSQVRAKEASQVGRPTNDESDEDEDVNQSTPELSTTMAGSVTRPQVRSSQTLMVPNNGRVMKRARSVSDNLASGLVAKHMKTFHQQISRQAPSMARGVSDMAATGQLFSGPSNTNLVQLPSMMWQCCHCFKRSSLNIINCENTSGGCSHTQCTNCVIWDSYGNRWRQSPLG